MHGKITYYNNNNGSGTIIDKNKRVYEFRSNAWHDLSTLPTKGMLAEFRLDDSGKISDCKSSKYQHFEPGGFLAEADFWSSDSDEALREMEERRREDRIERVADEIEMESVNTLEQNKSVEECLDFHFIHQSRIIDKYKQHIEGKRKIKTLDYQKLKRFIDKTMTQLNFFDKRIGEDEFHETKQELSELEFSYNSFMKYDHDNPDALFEEIYLSRQVNYLALKKRVTLEEENIFAMQNKLKKIASEHKMFENRIAQVGGAKTEQGQKFVEKLAQLDTQQKESEEIIEELREIVERTGALLEDFVVRVKEKFPKLYAGKKEQITHDMLLIINFIAYNMDTMIWKKASMSESVLNTFYKPGIYGSFSTMTFLYYYLKPLNKDRLNENDQDLYNIWVEYDHKIAKKVVLVSENPTLLHSLKVFMLGKDKETLVRDLTKPVEFFSYIKNNRADLVIVDANLRSIPAHELIIKGRKIYKNTDTTKFILFTE